MCWASWRCSGEALALRIARRSYLSAGRPLNRGRSMTFATRFATLAAVLIALAGLAFAHTGHGNVAGFTHGFMHPIGGLDHVLAMVAVGLYAALLGDRGLWAVPATVVAMMAIGGALGMAGVGLPYA